MPRITDVFRFGFWKTVTKILLEKVKTDPLVNSSVRFSVYRKNRVPHCLNRGTCSVRVYRRQQYLLDGNVECVITHNSVQPQQSKKHITWRVYSLLQWQLAARDDSNRISANRCKCCTRWSRGWRAVRLTSWGPEATSSSWWTERAWWAKKSYFKWWPTCFRFPV